MNNAIKEYIIKQLYEVADRIKSDSCEMDHRSSCCGGYRSKT